MKFMPSQFLLQVIKIFFLKNEINFSLKWNTLSSVTPESKMGLLWEWTLGFVTSFPYSGFLMLASFWFCCLTTGTQLTKTEGIGALILKSEAWLLCWALCQSDCLNEWALSGQALLWPPGWPVCWCGHHWTLGGVGSRLGTLSSTPAGCPHFKHSANCLDHAAFLETQGRRPGQPPPQGSGLVGITCLVLPQAPCPHPPSPQTPSSRRSWLILALESWLLNF